MRSFATVEPQGQIFSQCLFKYDQKRLINKRLNLRLCFDGILSGFWYTWDGIYFYVFICLFGKNKIKFSIVNDCCTFDVTFA